VNFFPPRIFQSVITLISLLLLCVCTISIKAQSSPTASLSCPNTAFVGEVVVCDGSSSTGVNGQNGWSTKRFTDGSSPVDMDFGDNQGPYSKARLLKSSHVYVKPGIYQITLLVKDALGVSATATPRTISVSEIPTSTDSATQILTDQGSPTANMAALQKMVNTAFANNFVPQRIRIAGGLQLTGQLFLPSAAGNNYVTIEPLDTTWMPTSLQRVNPALASNMPKFTAPAIGNASPIVVSGTGRRYLRVRGMEFNKPQGLTMNSLINLGNSPKTYAELPDHIIFEHCYIHGNLTDNTVRGFLLYGNDITILNSYFENFHDSGADSQTVAVMTGKRIGFVNNTAEANGENIMLGGGGTDIRFSATATQATPTSAVLSGTTTLPNIGDGISFMVAGNRGPWTASIVRNVSSNSITFDQITNAAGVPTAPDTTTGQVKYGSSPQDIFIARNYFYKNPAFRKDSSNYNGVYSVVKNSFELKHAMRVIVVGNIIENMWGNQGQDGHTVLFTPRNQTCYLKTFPHDPVTCPEQVNPWVMVSDIQWSYNSVKNIPDFFNILGTDNLNPPGTGDESGPSAYAQNITVEETIIEGKDPAGTSTGQLAFIWPCARNITFNHITQLNVAGGAWVASSNASCSSSQNVQFVNNIDPYQDYGLIGDGFQGDAFIARFFPDGFVRYNVLTDDRNTKNGTPFTAPRGGPNYFPPNLDSNIFVNRANGDYHVVSTSPFKAGGSTPALDGKDMGANVDDVQVATANTVSGNWSGTSIPTPSPTPSPTPTPSPSPSPIIGLPSGSNVEIVSAANVREAGSITSTIKFVAATGQLGITVGNCQQDSASVNIYCFVNFVDSTNGFVAVQFLRVITPVPTPTPTPTPIPSPTPTPTPTPVPVCAMSVPNSITISRRSSQTITVLLTNLAGATTVTATSSSGQITTSPLNITVSGSSASAQFLLTVKQNSGSMTFSSSCGTKTTTILVR